MTCAAKPLTSTPDTRLSRLRTSIKTTTTPTVNGLPLCIPMNSTQFGLVSSIYTVGGLFGALAIGMLASNPSNSSKGNPPETSRAGSLFSKFPSRPSGRLARMRLITLIFILGPVFEALASEIWVLVVGRFISGLGSGAALVVVPIYLAETAPPSEKGLFGALTQVMTNVGIVLAQLLGYFLSYGNMWRVVFAVAGGIGVVQIIGLWFVPESPKWLAERGQVDRARRILKRIRGRGVDIEEEMSGWEVGVEERGMLSPSPSWHQTSLHRMPTNPPEEESSLLLNSDDRPGSPPKKQSNIDPIGMFSVLTHPDHNKAIVAIIGVFFAQQLCGINSVIMYSNSILSSILPTAAGLITVAVGAVNLVVTIACAPLADRLGRKTCLLLSIAGMGTNALLLGLAILLNIQVLSAITTLLFVASFAVGLGPVPFILASELVGPEAVGAAQSWGLVASWIATFLVAQFFPMLDEALGEGKVYFVFAGTAVGFGAFVAWWVPETRGKKDLDEVWRRVVRRED